MSTEAKVGAFVLVSLLVLAVGVYFVQTTRNVNGQVVFKTYFRYAGGLAPGSPVLFGGIKAGQVRSVSPAAQDPTQIEIVFAVKPDIPLNEDSQARAGSISIMSSPALLITTGTHKAKLLSPGQTVPSEETVTLEETSRRIGELADSANALVADLRKDIPELTGDAHTVLANLNQITGESNQRQISEILAQVNTMMSRESPKIAQITDQISELAKHADSVVLSTKPIVSKIDRAANTVNSTLDGMHDPLIKAVTDLGETIDQARAVLVDVQKLVGTTRPDVNEAVRNLRVASENVRAMTESLKQRPWNLIRTTQPPDRKVPQ